MVETNLGGMAQYSLEFSAKFNGDCRDVLLLSEEDHDDEDDENE